MKLNRQMYLDKVHACWTGKNIGGTMGAPFEANLELLDIPGFTTPKGEPIPNDDLDLFTSLICKKIFCVAFYLILNHYYQNNFISTQENHLRPQTFIECIKENCIIFTKMNLCYVPEVTAKYQNIYLLIIFYN